MKLIALENALVDYTAYVNDDFLANYRLLKGSFNPITAGMKEAMEKSLQAVKSSGGSAANVCHGFANLGLFASFIASAGNDENADFYEQELTQAGIVPYIERKSGDTGVCMALITPDKERTLAVNMGESSSLQPEDIMEERFAGSAIFHTSAYALDSMYPAVLRAMDFAKKHNVKVSFELASVKSIQMHRDTIKYLLENYVDIVFANEEEAEEFTGKAPLQAIKELDRKAIAVVKLGGKGAIIGQPTSQTHVYGGGAKTMEMLVPSYKASAVKNTNGAGDAFAAGFLYGIVKGYNIYKAGKIGAFYAAKVVEVESARLPYRISDIEKLI